MRFILIALTLGAILTMNLSAANVETREWVFPPALELGDTIALVAPAKPVNERNLQEFVDIMEGWGFRVRLPDNEEAHYGYLAGEDDERVAAFMSAWLDPEVRCVWPVTGGYGTTRLLDRLDFEAIRANPKILIGMSDITGLHAAIGRETGLITFLGPNALWPIIRDDMGPCEYAQTWTWRALRDDLYRDPTGALLPPGYTFTYPQNPRDPQQGDDVKAPPETLVPGVGQGRLVGGNLSLIASLVGTPWQVETDGRILVLEDVGEEPYRIDRMFSQLRNAGMLDDLNGVVLGTWRRCSPENPERSLSLRQIFEDYFAEAPYPVLLNFPTGHVPEQATLPLNCLAELDAGARRLTLLENPVAPRGR